MKHTTSWRSWTALESRPDEVPCEAAASEAAVCFKSAEGSSSSGASYPERRPILRDAGRHKPRKTLSFSDAVETREISPNPRSPSKSEATSVDSDDWGPWGCAAGISGVAIESIDSRAHGPCFEFAV